jgi:GDP-L-fucose synthase
MNILVTGGSGMVGSSLKSRLTNADYPSSSELDLTNQSSIESFLSNKKYDYIIHLAAHVGNHHDNSIDKISYLDKNIIMNTLLTKAAYEHEIKNFLGILSTCIFPDQLNEYPMKEEVLHLGPPHKDLFSYGYAKRTHAVQLDSYKTMYDVNYNYLIPSNLYGIVTDSHFGRTHYVNDLIFKIIKHQKSNLNELELYGDGTPLRQFMFVEDFTSIIEQYVKKNINASFNVAPPENLSIDEIAKIAVKTCSSEDMKIVYNPSYPNGQHRKDVCISKFRNFFPDFKFTPLNEGIKFVYDYYKDRKINEI